MKKPISKIGNLVLLHLLPLYMELLTKDLDGRDGLSHLEVTAWPLLLYLKRLLQNVF